MTTKILRIYFLRYVDPKATERQYLFTRIGADNPTDALAVGLSALPADMQFTELEAQSDTVTVSCS